MLAAVGSSLSMTVSPISRATSSLEASNLTSEKPSLSVTGVSLSAKSVLSMERENNIYIALPLQVNKTGTIICVPDKHIFKL